MIFIENPQRASTVVGNGGFLISVRLLWKQKLRLNLGSKIFIRDRHLRKEGEEEFELRGRQNAASVRLGTIHIRGQTILCWERESWAFSRIAGLHLLGASSTSSSYDNKKYFQKWPAVPAGGLCTITLGAGPPDVGLWSKKHPLELLQGGLKRPGRHSLSLHATGKEGLGQRVLPATLPAAKQLISPSVKGTRVAPLLSASLRLHPSAPRSPSRLPAHPLFKEPFRRRKLAGLAIAPAKAVGYR